MNLGFVLESIVTFFGVTSSFAYLNQARVIWKRKSSADVSILTFAYFLAGQTAYLVYGFYLGSIPIIATFIANMLSNSLVIALAIAFRKRATQKPEIA